MLSEFHHLHSWVRKDMMAKPFELIAESPVIDSVGIGNYGRQGDGELEQLARSPPQGWHILECGLLLEQWLQSIFNTNKGSALYLATSCGCIRFPLLIVRTFGLAFS